MHPLPQRIMYFNNSTDEAVLEAAKLLLQMSSTKSIEHSCNSQGVVTNTRRSSMVTPPPTMIPARPRTSSMNSNHDDRVSEFGGDASRHPSFEDIAYEPTDGGNSQIHIEVHHQNPVYSTPVKERAHYDKVVFESPEAEAALLAQRKKRTKKARSMISTLHINQAALAKVTGVHPSTLSEWLNDKRIGSVRIDQAGEKIMTYLESVYRREEDAQ